MLNLGIAVILGLTNRLGAEATNQWIKNLREQPPHIASDLQRQYEENGQRIVDFTNRIEQLSEEIQDEKVGMQELWIVAVSLKQNSEKKNELRCGDLWQLDLSTKLQRVRNRIVNACYDFERQNVRSLSDDLFSDTGMDELKNLLQREDAANGAHLQNMKRVKEALADRQELIRGQLARRRTTAALASTVPWAVAGMSAMGIVVVGSRRLTRKQRH